MKINRPIAFLVSLTVAIAFCICLWPYYPNKTKILLFVLPLFALLATASKTSNQISVVILFAIMPFFGNHPGGRFLELFILICFVWAVAASLTQLSTVNRTFLSLYILFGLIILLPLFLNLNLWLEINHHKIGLYYLLFANEHSPLYIFQQSLWILFVPIFVFLLKPHIRLVVMGISLAFSMVIILGLLEAFSPTIVYYINKMHIYIDGYNDVHLPHGITREWISNGWVVRSPQSFFFNRSWHSVYLIAALPFITLSYVKFIQGLHKLSLTHKNLITLCIILVFSFYLLLIGARGAWIAWAGFLFVLSVGILLTRLLKKKSRSILTGWFFSASIITALLIQIMVPILTVFFGIGNQEPRYLHFAAAYHIFSMFPIWGGGTESFGFWNSHSLRLFGTSSIFGSSHNAFLQILAGNGLFGAGLYISIILIIAIQIKNKIQTELTIHKSTLQSLIIAAGMVATLLYGSVQEWNYIRPVTVLWLLLFGLPLYRSAIIKAEKSYKVMVTPIILTFIFAVGFFLSYGRTLITAPQSNINIAFIDNDNIESLPITQKTIPAGFQKLPIQGSEYHAKENKFLIFEGESAILLPINVNPTKILNLNQNTIYLGWQIDSYLPQYHLLRMNCQTKQSYQTGDPDSRKLCFELYFDHSILLNQFQPQ